MMWKHYFWLALCQLPQGIVKVGSQWNLYLTNFCISMCNYNYNKLYAD